MHHPTFDLAYWQGVFSKEPVARHVHTESEPGKRITGPSDLGAYEYWRSQLFWRKGISGPFDVCAYEYWRAQLRLRCDFGPAVPADIFVFGIGEPADRSLTKIGGVPYRPANLPWPRESLDDDDAILVANDNLESLLNEEEREDILQSGESITEYVNELFPFHRFLGQFNFADSLDLVGPLPGDVLLLFGTFDWPFIKYYEWHRLGLANLVSPSAVPTANYIGPEEKTFAYYAQRHRTCDYPNANHSIEGELDADALFRLKAHRIGGAPYLIQDEPYVPGRVICVFDGVSPRPDVSWPWLNVNAHVRPLGDEDPIHPAVPNIDLDASIYISIDEENKLHWIDQCT